MQYLRPGHKQMIKTEQSRSMINTLIESVSVSSFQVLFGRPEKERERERGRTKGKRGQLGPQSPKVPNHCLVSISCAVQMCKCANVQLCMQITNKKVLSSSHYIGDSQSQTRWTLGMWHCPMCHSKRQIPLLHHLRSIHGPHLPMLHYKNKHFIAGHQIQIIIIKRGLGTFWHPFLLWTLDFGVLDRWACLSLSLGHNYYLCYLTDWRSEWVKRVILTQSNLHALPGKSRVNT